MLMLLIRCSYVMSADMKLACDMYAQWLDDSTRVSAKDLVHSIYYYYYHYYHYYY